jgi:hypothetical protein
MTSLLEIAYYTMSQWAHPIRAAIDSKRSLQLRDAQWSQGRLSDLAFALSTRLGYLRDIVRFIDGNLAVLGADLDARRSEIAGLLREGKAYTFRYEDYGAVRRVLIGGGAFITESRACFENLADFYRDFLKTYFDEVVGDTAAGHAAVAAMTTNRQWASALRNARHDVLHGRSMWIAFEVRDTEPRYEPMLLLNWRPGHFLSEDCIKFQALREIRDGLHEAAEGTRDRLIQRVRSLPG